MSLLLFFKRNNQITYLSILTMYFRCFLFASLLTLYFVELKRSFFIVIKPFFKLHSILSYYYYFRSLKYDKTILIAIFQLSLKHIFYVFTTLFRPSSITINLPLKVSRIHDYHIFLHRSLKEMIEAINRLILKNKNKKEKDSSERRSLRSCNFFLND